MINATRNVSIYTRMDDGRWLWSGDGHIDGDIVCTADLGDDVYEALDGAIGDEDGEYVVEVDGVEYRVDVTTVGAPEIGLRVEAGEGDDYDQGTIVAIDGDQITVAWDTLVRTTQSARLLTLID